jgi:hypothetical protein
MLERIERLNNLALVTYFVVLGDAVKAASWV